MCNRNKIDFSWGPCKAGKIVNETGSMHRAKNTVIEFKAIILKKEGRSVISGPIFLGY